LTGKEHKHVLRDIDNLLKTLGPDLGRGFSMAYDGDPAHGYRYFTMDRDSTYCLLTGYDATARMLVIRRWQELEGAVTAKTAKYVSRYRGEIAEFKGLMGLCKVIGLDHNAAVLSANQAVAKVSGTNLLEVLGQTHLAADDQEHLYFTPTELGQRIGVSGRKFNLLLADIGLQVREGEAWVPLLPVADDFCRIYDTGKKHGSGVPVLQVKWSDGVLNLVRPDELNA